MYKDLIIASNNKNKIREIKAIFTGIFENVYSLADKGIDIEIEETGSTFIENATIKAKTISDMTGMVTLADDSGLEVLALNGEPGVYSARYAGEPCDDEANNTKLLDVMKDITDRRAKFTSAVVLYFPDGKVLSATGSTDGTILYKGEGNGGFGYDPLFMSSELCKTFGIATAEEKNQISHRARALENLKNLLK